MAISSEDVEAIKEELREGLREEVKEDLREEFSPRGRTRRDVLKMGGAALGGAALGSVGGAAGAVGPGDEFLDVGDVTANTYRVASNWYGGNDGAKAELVTELGNADAGARFTSDDTGELYRWNGSAWIFMGLGDSKPTAVYDTGNRYLGELTGSNDAQVIIDAIADRSTNFINIPMTSFPIDIEQEITLPADEDEFGIQTEGRPRLEVSSSFSGGSIFNKPATGGGRAEHWFIDSFKVDDPNGLADWSLRMIDIKNSEIRSWYTENVPGLYVGAEDDTSNQVAVYGWRTFVRGPCVHLAAGTPGADQMHIYHPFFNERNAVSFSETGFYDGGQNNNWHDIRVEQCLRGLEIHGRQGHFGIQDMDRAGDMQYSVFEAPGAGPSTITGLSHPNRHEHALITHPQTTVTETIGRPYSSAGGNHQVVDVLDEMMKGAQGNQTPSYLRDLSTGLAVNWTPGTTGPEPVLRPSPTTGNTGHLATQENIFKGQAYPKFATGIVFGDVTNDLTRIGLRDADTSPTNFAEIIHDPTDALSGTTHGSLPGAPTSQLHFRVVEGGTETATVPLVWEDASSTAAVPSTSEDYLYSVSRRSDGDAGDTKWSAVITREASLDGSGNIVYPADGNAEWIGAQADVSEVSGMDGTQLQAMWFVEQRGSVGFVHRIATKYGIRLLRI